MMAIHNFEGHQGSKTTLEHTMYQIKELLPRIRDGSLIDLQRNKVQHIASRVMADELSNLQRHPLERGF